MSRGTWTVDELRAEVDRYEEELRQAGFARSTVHTYVNQSSRFVRWLSGDYKPGDR